MRDSNTLTAKEAAERMGRTVRSIAQLCANGTLVGAFKDRKGRWRIPIGAVDSTGRLKAPRKNISLSIGNTSYPDVVKNSYYVDKTRLVKELLDDKCQAVLFTRPRRFGKSLALDMIRTFFEMSDEDTSVYFSKMDIWKCGDPYRNHQGQYPVIVLNFKDAKYSTWAETFESIQDLIAKEYLRHSELAASSKLTKEEKQYYKGIASGQLGEVKYASALLNLTHMLQEHHGRPVVVLIDEYDTPIQQGYMEGFYDDVIGFMRNFLSGGLKDNKALFLGVLTGILRVSKENLFSGLNNLVVNTIIDEKYSELFGFTEQEVLEMAKAFGDDDKMDEIRKWYDGYRFGNTDIYNPWSVTNYFYNGCKPRAYWANTSENEILKSLLANLKPGVAENLLSLLQGTEVKSKLDMEVVYPRITDGMGSVFSFLLVAGYLKPTGELEETEIGTFASLAIPNLEIKRVYNTEILSWIGTGVGPDVVDRLQEAIVRNQASGIREVVVAYMRNCISYFDGAAEGFFHGMMLGLVAGMSSRYYIRSNRESGDGRFDLQLEPKQHGIPGIIMEFKAVGKEDKTDLKTLALGALDQIDDNGYTTDMRDRGIAEIYEYGIAFRGKDAEVVAR